MSNEGYMTKAGATGQRGRAKERTYDDLNPDQKAVLNCLRGAGFRMKIRQIVESNGWHVPCKTKGNSRVRNALRNLVRDGFVQHENKFGDGAYVAGGKPAAPVPMPLPISRKQVADMSDDLRLAGKIKKTDCSLYNACLDQAISGKWQGFACTGCKAYAMPDEFQKEMDQVRLAAISKASELIEKYGKVHRVRGVKPGAEAKRTHRLKVVETVSLSEALAASD